MSSSSASAPEADAPRSPYKFLAPYGLEDSELFFGRERETKVLLADVVVSRLVVLFAPTGSGKTSLINAGVRPALHRRGYASFFVRVQEDPVRSARAVLEAEAGAPLRRKVSLARQLDGLARDLEQPIVLFFDQFEEFFLYVARRDAGRARQFVKGIADLHGRESGRVHVVFSMREEFLGEMDLFREEIPEIFHTDSNLRLRWFEPEQARAAIVEPARTAGVAIDKALESRLLRDLSSTGRALGGSADAPIEPAQLQIVCDTVWRQRAQTGRRLTLRTYLGLARPGRSENVAQQIVDQRLEQEIEQLEGRRELDLLDQLLGELHTERGTKWVRELGALAHSLEATPGELRQLVAQLQKANLIRLVSREDTELVELVHDYLAEPARMQALRRAARTARPRRWLHAAQHSGAPLGGEALREIAEHLDALRLKPAEGILVLRSALQHGLSVEPMLVPLERSGTRVWAVLADRLRKGDEAEAAAVIESLSWSTRPEASRLLQQALKRPELALRVVTLLGRAESRLAVDILAGALERTDVGPHARDSLARLTRTHVRQEVSETAADALRRWFHRRLKEPGQAISAVRALGTIEAPIAVDLAEDALKSESLREPALEASAALAASTRPDVAQRARAALLSSIEAALTEGRASPRSIELLAATGEPEAVALLERALAEPRLAPVARAALRALLASEVAGAVDVAQRALDARSPVPAPPPPQPARPPTRLTSPELDAHLQLIARQFEDRRVVPFVGAGASLAGRPPDLRWSPDAPFPPSGRELAQHLAQHFSYPTDVREDLELVAQYAEITAGRGYLERVLSDVFRRPHPPTSVHRLLARLPLALFVTAGYDDVLERALAAEGRRCTVVSYVGSGRWRAWEWGPNVPVTRLRFDEPGELEELLADRTSESGTDVVVLRLFGGGDPMDEDADSYVISEDDQIDAMLRQSTSLPRTLGARIVRSSLLFLGMSLREWSLRALLFELWREALPRFKSWAVLREPTTLDEEYWRTRNLEVLDVALEDYVQGLGSVLHLGEAPPPPRTGVRTRR